jgi:hypothetical protein
MNWFEKGKPGWFSDLPLIIRRSSIAKTGLFNPHIIQLDTEFSIRITSLDINIAWNTCALALRILNEQSTQLKNDLEEESLRIGFFYDREFRESILDTKKQSKLKSFNLKNILTFRNTEISQKAEYKEAIKTYYQINETLTSNFNVREKPENFGFLFEKSYDFLLRYNRNLDKKIICKDVIN